MAGYNSSTAYDLSLFEQESKKELSAPELKVLKNRKKIATPVLSPGVICAFVIITTLLSLMIYNHVQLNILTTEINKLSSEMETLQSENVRMTSILDSSISTTELKELAAALGMQKRDEYQTKRIYLYQEDKIERTEAAPSAENKDMAKLAVASLFSRFKEYLTGR